MTGSDRLAPAGSLLAALVVALLPSAAAPYQSAGRAPAHAVPVSSRPSPATALRLRLTELPTAEALPAAHTHTIAAGETLWDIARASGVTVASLAGANHITEASTLHPGQVLRLPAPGTPAPRAALRTSGPARHAAESAPVRAETPTMAERLRMLWPSSGTITSRFGWRVHPIFGTREFHTGLDIATRWGSPVIAVRSGMVRFAGWMAGYGRLVVVDHGSGLQTMYSHLSTMLVGSGQHVDQGDVIGRIGNTGWSTGPHLFFEVRQNGVPQDPSHYLR